MLTLTPLLAVLGALQIPVGLLLLQHPLLLLEKLSPALFPGSTCARRVPLEPNRNVSVEALKLQKKLLAEQPFPLHPMKCNVLLVYFRRSSPRPEPFQMFTEITDWHFSTFVGDVQVPLLQVCPLLQVLPQLPQWLVSVCRLRQPPEQHDVPPVQTLPHAPQLLLSV